MVTRNYTQLKEDKITEDLSICDSSEPNLKNFCGKRRRKPRRTMFRYRKIQCISRHNKGVKHNVPLYKFYIYYFILWKKQGSLSITATF